MLAPKLITSRRKILDLTGKKTQQGTRHTFLPLIVLAFIIMEQIRAKDRKN